MLHDLGEGESDLMITAFKGNPVTVSIKRRLRKSGIRPNCDKKSAPIMALLVSAMINGNRKFLLDPRLTCNNRSP